MNDTLAYTLTTTKPFDEVVTALERLVPEHQFRVLHVHDVQGTLAEKGLQRAPLKIIEVCNAGFAHQALQKAMQVALFMPCRFTVHTNGTTTIVNLARPTMISQMLPDSGLDALAADVEATLKKVMQAAL